MRSPLSFTFRGITFWAVKYNDEELVIINRYYIYIYIIDFQFIQCPSSYIIIFRFKWKHNLVVQQLSRKRQVAKHHRTLVNVPRVTYLLSRGSKLFDLYWIVQFLNLYPAIFKHKEHFCLFLSILLMLERKLVSKFIFYF